MSAPGGGDLARRSPFASGPIASARSGTVRLSAHDTYCFGKVFFTRRSEPRESRFRRSKVGEQSIMPGISQSGWVSSWGRSRPPP